SIAANPRRCFVGASVWVSCSLMAFSFAPGGRVERSATGELMHRPHSDPGKDRHSGPRHTRTPPGGRWDGKRRLVLPRLSKHQAAGVEVPSVGVVAAGSVPVGVVAGASGVAVEARFGSFAIALERPPEVPVMSLRRAWASGVMLLAGLLAIWVASCWIFASRAVMPGPTVERLLLMAVSWVTRSGMFFVVSVVFVAIRQLCRRIR